MAEKGKYDSSDATESQLEPNSRGRVLKNLRGIKRKREMDLVEAKEQLRALEDLIAEYDKDHRFTTKDVCSIHRTWLGSVYTWAGLYRQVNISKKGFLFASARQIALLMGQFERGPLRKYTPCVFTSSDDIAKALAVVHTELVLIHPFREGNGRLARMVAILMALQGGLPPLDFGGIRGRKRQAYFAAVRAGLERNYEPMQAIFSGVIRRTLRLHGK